MMNYKINILIGLLFFSTCNLYSQEKDFPDKIPRLVMLNQDASKISINKMFVATDTIRMEYSKVKLLDLNDVRTSNIRLNLNTFDTLFIGVNPQKIYELFIENTKINVYGRIFIDTLDKIFSYNNFYKQLVLASPNLNNFFFNKDVIENLRFTNLVIKSNYTINPNPNLDTIRIDNKVNKWSIDFYNCISTKVFHIEVDPTRPPTSINIVNCEIQGVGILGTQDFLLNLPDTLNFEGTTLLNDFNLQSTFLDKDRRASKCKLIIDGASIDKFDLNYDNFQLCFVNKNYESVISIYQRLLANFKVRGYTESFNKLDIEYKDYILSKNPTAELYLEKYWWNYRYNKGWIFRWTIGMFGFFFFINIFFIRKYLINVYDIPNINKILVEDLKKFSHSKNKKLIRNTLIKAKCSFFYTLLIFFGLKLNSDCMNYRKTGGVLYIYLMYITGIFCTFFIANYFLFK